MKDTDGILLRVHEVAQRLQLSARTVRALTNRAHNPMPVIRIGRSVRYRWSEVCRWIEATRFGELSIKSETQDAANELLQSAARKDVK